jgi:hypothetical protein
MKTRSHLLIYSLANCPEPWGDDHFPRSSVITLLKIFTQPVCMLAVWLVELMQEPFWTIWTHVPTRAQLSEGGTHAASLRKPQDFAISSFHTSRSSLSY